MSEVILRHATRGCGRGRRARQSIEHGVGMPHDMLDACQSNPRTCRKGRINRLAYGVPITKASNCNTYKRGF
jgi:hypothetical protein